MNIYTHPQPIIYKREQIEVHKIISTIRSSLSTINTHPPQLSQPNANVATSWWASSLLIEYTDDEICQQELEEGLHSKYCDLDTTFEIYPLVT